MPFWFPIAGDYVEELHGGALDLKNVPALQEVGVTSPRTMVGSGRGSSITFPLLRPQANPRACRSRNFCGGNGCSGQRQQTSRMRPRTGCSRSQHNEAVGDVLGDSLDVLLVLIEIKLKLLQSLMAQPAASFFNREASLTRAFETVLRWRFLSLRLGAISAVASEILPEHLRQEWST